MSLHESWAGSPLNPGVRPRRSGVVIGGIRALNELMPGKGSRTLGIGLLRVEQMSIVGDIRYVC